MKNGKYTKYSRIFHTFAWGKISCRISLPHYAVLPLLKYLRFYRNRNPPSSPDYSLRLGSPCTVTVSGYSVGLTNVLASYTVEAGEAVIAQEKDAQIVVCL